MIPPVDYRPFFQRMSVTPDTYVVVPAGIFLPHLVIGGCMGRSATVEKAEASEKKITATTPPHSLNVFACSFFWIVLRLVAEAVQSLAGESVRIYVEGYAVVGAAVSDVPPGYTYNCTYTCTWKSILILDSFLFGLDEGSHSEYFSSVFLQHRSGGTHWCVCTVECGWCVCTFILYHTRLVQGNWVSCSPC